MDRLYLETRRVGLSLRGLCTFGRTWLPVSEFRVVGIAEFPVDGASRFTAATSLSDFARACGEENPDEADLLLVASRPGVGAAAAAAAIRRRLPDLNPVTTEELLDQLQGVGFTYFRQIAVVLATVTLFFNSPRPVRRNTRPTTSFRWVRGLGIDKVLR